MPKGTHKHGHKTKTTQKPAVLPADRLPVGLDPDDGGNGNGDGDTDASAGSIYTCGPGACAQASWYCGSVQDHNMPASRLHARLQLQLQSLIEVLADLNLVPPSDTPGSAFTQPPLPPFVEPEDDYHALEQPRLTTTTFGIDHSAQLDDPFTQVDNVEEDEDPGLPIPIPVPRSQTPQLVTLPQQTAPQPLQRHHEPSAPISAPRFPSLAQPLHVNPDIEYDLLALSTSPGTNERFSYGYGHPCTPSVMSPVLPSFPPLSPVNQPQSPTSPRSADSMTSSSSILTRTIRTAPATFSSPSRRFTAPLPFIRLEESKAAPAPAVTLDPDAAGAHEGEFAVNHHGANHSGSGRRSEGAAGKEAISWARWDEAVLPPVGASGTASKTSTTRLLIVAYTAPIPSLRIWDASDLSALSETLRIPISLLASDRREKELGTLVHGAILPRCSRRIGQDGEEVLLGLAFDTGLFVVYSLTSHRSLTRFTIISASGKSQARSRMDANPTIVHSFAASDEFIVISTTSPQPGLHIRDAATFAPLTTIPSEQLALYASPPFTQPLDLTAMGVGVGVVASAGASAKALLSSAWAAGGLNLHSISQPQGTTNTSSDTTTNNLHNTQHRQRHISLSNNQTSTTNVLPSTHPQPRPHAVFALSHRLLAFVSPTPGESFPRGPIPPTNIPSASSQADMLLRVGGTVWGGMRVLGGKAVEAARSRIEVGATGGMGGAMGRFFSGSALERERVQRKEQERSITGSVSPTATAEGVGGGCIVTVVDLKALLNGSAGAGGVVKTVVEFKLENESKRASGLAFSPDGCSLAVVPRDGHTVSVYNIRPALTRLRPSFSRRSVDGVDGGAGSAWNVYNLKRGRTSAVVESVEWSKDGRWVAVASRNRTVHVFGVNPYGSKADMGSHLEGRVMNIDGSQPMPLDLVPVVRLRTTVAAPLEQLHVPLAFTFLSFSTESSLSPQLIPSYVVPSPPSHARFSSGSYGTNNPPSPVSSTHLARRHTTNFQDILLYDPVEALLMLRRVSLDVRTVKGHGISLVAGALGVGRGGVGATSTSLPGMGSSGGGSIASSPSKGSPGPFGSRGLVHPPAQEAVLELVGRENTVMSWSLRKKEGSSEIRKIIGPALEKGQGTSGQADWLAQAELSTCSKPHKCLPRPIYLSYQFSFHSLGEDYHALMRRYQLDIGGPKIDVRREVQISAYPTGRGGESFVEGFTSPRDIRHRTLSSSFDEPLASALSNEIDHLHTLGVLPMLPNGSSSSHPQSFRSTIPIRSIGDGMSESLGRLRREINRVRSSKMRPRPDSSMSITVPLEFDEEDEDFLGRDLLDVPPLQSSRDTSRGDGDSGPTVSTPTTSAHTSEDGEMALDPAEDIWGGWSLQDKTVVEDMERFDNVDVLGLLDEEQVAVKEIGKTRKKGRGRQ